MHMEYCVGSTYIHTYIPTYLPTYLPTYIHTYIHTYMCIYVYLHLFIIYLSLYIHICVTLLGSPSPATPKEYCRWFYGTQTLNPPFKPLYHVRTF